MLEHRYECPAYGQRHAAWSYDWEPHPLPKAEPPGGARLLVVAGIALPLARIWWARMMG